MSKTQGELTIYLKSYLLAWSRHIRSHIREKRIIPTWIGRPGFPLLKRLWQRRSFRSSFHAKPSRLLKGWAPQRNTIPTPDHRVWIGRDPDFLRTNNIRQSFRTDCSYNPRLPPGRTAEASGESPWRG